MLSDSFSGASVEALGELALELERAAEDLHRRARAVDAAFAPLCRIVAVSGDIRAVADWCERSAREVRRRANELIVADLRARRDAMRTELARLDAAGFAATPSTYDARDPRFGARMARRDDLVRALGDLDRLVRRLDEIERGVLGRAFFEDPEGLGSGLSGAVLGEFGDNDSWSAAAGSTLAGLVPYVGQVADGRDIFATVWRRRWAALPFAILAVVPGLDFLKGGSRLGRRVLSELWASGLPKVSNEGIRVLATKVGHRKAARLAREILVLKLARAELVARMSALLANPSVPAAAKHKIESARSALEDHLHTDDLVGAVRDRAGVPVAKNADEDWNHVLEVQEARKSLDNAFEAMRKALPEEADEEAWKAYGRQMSTEMKALAETSARIRALLSRAR